MLHRFPALGFVTFGLAVAWCLAGGAENGPQISPGTFEDAAVDAGLDFVQRSGSPEQRYIVEVKSTGAALLDVDGNGLLDIFFTSGSTIERTLAKQPGFGGRLYRNLGNLRFEDITAESGLPPLGWACGVAAADVDGNGADDLFITCYGPDRLFLNRDGVFVEAEHSGLGGDVWSTGAAFGDLDGDGDLDLYVAGYLEFDFANPPTHGKGFSCLWKKQVVACGPRGLPKSADRVYENRGNGFFIDATKKWGFDAVPAEYGLGVLIADLVGDPRPDVFVANDSSPNYLFENRGGKFVEVGFMAGVSYSEDGTEQAGMGVDAIDLDGDGRLEIVVTNFEEERNNLYLNNAQGQFKDAADTWGIGLPSHGPLAWGVGFHDFDNDGLIDLFVANGHVYPQADAVEGHRGYAQRDHLFLAERQEHRVRFVERGLEKGLVQKRVSRGAAFGDLDNDGDVDVVVCHMNDRPALYENRLADANRSVVLTLAQPGSNRQAIGARIDATFGTVKRVTEVRRQSSFQCSHDPRVFIGLGKTTPAGVVRVRWPDGATETFAVPAGGGDVTLTRGRGKE